jgi:YD repeat-containing protein
MKYKLTYIAFLAGIFCFNATAQKVNEFTGDFNYSIPLLNVPADGDQGIPISISYNSGIGVDMTASEVGLGWSISSGGGITRMVSGIPDDWKRQETPSLQYGEYRYHNGTLYLQGSGSDNLFDFYNSSFKIDSPYFYFPDYDNYFVSTPAMGGVMGPRIFDYEHSGSLDAYNKYKVNDNNIGQNHTPQFMFANDFHDTLELRHYPWSELPIDANTTHYLAGDEVSGDNTDYAGGAYVESTNRIKTGRFVEYFTNQQIYDHYTTPVTDEIEGFIDFEEVTTSDRDDTDKYDPDGLGAFRITNTDGKTYHFSLPVYTRYSASGNFYLNNDYTSRDYGQPIRTGGEGSYLLKDNDSTVLELKKNIKFATQWLLVGITGPDYKDENDNGIIDEGDKGYWVKYDWQLWADNFKGRYPNSGYSYSFAPLSDRGNSDLPVDDAGKITGKYGNFNTTSKQLYYLNSIQTPSHAAIFVRDIRLDEHSIPEHYDDHFYRTANLALAAQTFTEWYGTLYDDGGPTEGYGDNSVMEAIIDMENVDGIELTFPEFTVGNCNQQSNDDDLVYVFKDGDQNTGTLVGTYNSYAGNFPPNPLSIDSDIISVVFDTDGSNHCDGFKMTWRATWDNEQNGITEGRPKVVPQLSLSKIVLLRNEDFNNLETVGALTSTHPIWDLTATTATSGKHFHTQWYSSNQTAIESASLRTVELNQDYSLARKYHGNVNVYTDATIKTTSPEGVMDGLEVATDQYENSGKLTLNKIVTYELGHEQIQPAHLLDYNASNTYDNPDFNPKMKDYWGNYKSDVTGKGFGGYQTDTSAKYVDAWCLRKITEPVGSELEITYESDEYEKVISDRAGGVFIGPVRVYPFQEVTAIEDSLGFAWTFSLEDEDEGFWDYVDNLPLGAKHNFLVPFDGKELTYCDDADYQYIHFGIGTGSFTKDGVGDHSFRNLKDSMLYKIPRGEEYGFYISEYISSGDPMEYFTNLGIYGEDCENPELRYTGRGYVSFDLPIGEKVYGGGVRVKQLTTRNGTIDAYTTEYLYEGGVTPSEPDWYAPPLEESYGLDEDDNEIFHLKKLKGKLNDLHQMGAGVGYSTVRMRNMGQVDSANGEVVFNFITSPEGWDYYAVTTSKDEHDAGGSCSSPNGLDTTYVINVSNQFVSLWGQMESREVRDVNDRIVSLSKNEFEAKVIGAMVEAIQFTGDIEFVSSGGGGSCYGTDEIICIRRDYTTRLKKQRNYSNGHESITEILQVDPITGIPTLSREVDPSIGEMINVRTPAFRISDYADMGPKSVNIAYKNTVARLAETKALRDTALINVSDFISYTINTWQDSLTSRRYDKVSDRFKDFRDPINYWVPKAKYNWAGPLAEFGIFDDDSLVNFDHDPTISNNIHWRNIGEVARVDKLGHVIENRGFNNRFVVKKFGYNNERLIAEAKNTNYESFTFTGFEDLYDADPSATVANYFGGEFRLNTGSDTTKSEGTILPHTGNYMLEVPDNASSWPMYNVKYNGLGDAGEELGLHRGRVYSASVWVHSSSPDAAKLVAKLDGNYNVTEEVRRDDANNVQVGEWILMKLTITVPADYVSAGGTNNDLRFYLENAGSGDAYYDDFRFHPIDAPITGNVIDDKTGRLIATLNQNNFASKFEYDAMGRITKMWSEREGIGWKLMEENAYNFARDLEQP